MKTSRLEYFCIFFEVQIRMFELSSSHSRNRLCTISDYMEVVFIFLFLLAPSYLILYHADVEGANFPAISSIFTLKQVMPILYEVYSLTIISGHALQNNYQVTRRLLSASLILLHNRWLAVWQK